MKIVSFSFCLLIAVPFFGQFNLAKVDSIAQSAHENNSFEGSILIADQGEIRYHKSFGFSDGIKENPILNTSTFGIASITKMFTAIVVLQLVEEGKISIKSNLKQLLPELKIPKAKKITIHHLLLHISGLPNENDSIYRQATSPMDFIAETLGNKKRKIGSFNYANIDYILLGLIIEKIEKRPWHEAIKSRILDRCNLQQTGFLAFNNYPKNFAFPFSFKDGIRNKDPLFFIENFYAAGCMYSTAVDLLQLDQAMYGNLLLSDKSLKLLYTSYPEYNYTGYSVWTYRYPFLPNQPKVMERRGGIQGSNSVLLRFIELNRTIIILSNNDQFNPDSFGYISGLKEALMMEIGIKPD